MSVRDELRRIYDGAGELTPGLVVDTARPEDSPLHSHFEWDDGIAGEKYRQVQAAAMIRSVHVRFEKPDGGNIRVRQYVVVPTVAPDSEEGPDIESVDSEVTYYGTETVEEETRSRYLSVQTVIDDRRMSDALKNQMYMDWRRMKDRYVGFREFEELVRSEARGFDEGVEA